MAISSDGITWNYNTTYTMTAPVAQYGYFLLYDGSRYILGGNGSNTNPATGYSSTGNISTSQDGITWTTNNVSLPFDIRRIAYNGKDTYVGVGTKNGFIAGTIFYYWSNDLINWYPANNNLLGNTVAWVDWNGTYFVVSGDITAGITTIYSADGKTWTASTNSLMTGSVYGVTTITY